MKTEEQPMTQEEKIKYMRIAAGICNFGFTIQQLDLLVSLYELVVQTEGSGTMYQVMKVEDDVKNRADTKSKQDLLDKVSDKV